MKWQTMETAPKDRPILAWLSEEELCAAVKYVEGGTENDEPLRWVWSVCGDEDREVCPVMWMELPDAPEPPAPPEPCVYADHVVFDDGEILEIDPEAFAQIFFRDCWKTYSDIDTCGKGWLTLEYRGLRFVAVVATVVKEQTSGALATCLQIVEWEECDDDYDCGFSWELEKVVDPYLLERVMLWVRP